MKLPTFGAEVPVCPPPDCADLPGKVLEIDGKKPAWRSLEDIINVPPKATVRIAWYPDDRPGMWMYHCHILEHHAAGMMAHFEVVR